MRGARASPSFVDSLRFGVGVGVSGSGPKISRCSESKMVGSTQHNKTRTMSTMTTTATTTPATSTRSKKCRHWPMWSLLLSLASFLPLTQALDLNRLYYGYYNKREGEMAERKCEAFEPFKCPIDGRCISIQYLCDGAPDCLDAYDEDPKLCTAARRPPVEETTSFLNSLLASHGPNYLEKLFGSKARHRLRDLGGVNEVAIALSESQTIEDFGNSLNLPRADLEHLRSVFLAVENGDIGMLKSLGIKDSELGDVKFFLEKLVNTGFLD